jgi:hypothetical protein
MPIGAGRSASAASASSRSVFENAAQPATAGRMPQLLQGVGLDLAHSLPTELQRLADIFQGESRARVQPEAPVQYTPPASSAPACSSSRDRPAPSRRLCPGGSRPAFSPRPGSMPSSSGKGASHGCGSSPACRVATVLMPRRAAAPRNTARDRRWRMGLPILSRPGSKARRTFVVDRTSNAVRLGEHQPRVTRSLTALPETPMFGWYATGGRRTSLWWR